jgi:eukaryotic-like serine/threonine-protein kinase
MVGKSLLHFEIQEKIGKGGMGEVFRARDTKLGRDVALKVLPAELSGEPEREARFQREARALASLQHTNVASVYGFEEVDGIRFLVMELVTGSELTQRMSKGPVNPDEALNFARQIAAGLEAAHESGIVHRDLKPANIMETDEGEIKILDFGLAQAWFGDNPNQSDSVTNPTITAAMTQVGTILGTAAYMSPEQARGSNVDRRADIWAFGVIMFEMLTGKKLFHGETISDTLAAVLRDKPDWDSLPVNEAPALCRLIERCLERNPKQRLRDIGEARIFLEDGGSTISNLSFSSLGLEEASAAPGKKKSPAFMIGLALLFFALGGALGWKVLATSDPVPVLHAMIPPPDSHEYDLKGSAPGAAALSPDGQKLAFCAQDEEGVTRLFLRHLDKGESVGLSGTEGAAYPFWSPDSRFIGYFDFGGQKLRKVAIAGGPPITLCVANNVKGGSWNDNDEIIFSPTADSGVFKVPAIGGEPVQLTKVGPEHNSHRHPRFLPGGKEFIYVARKSSNGGDNNIFLASLDTTIAPRIISNSQVQAEYSFGQLLTVREGVLMATPFSPDQEKVTDGGTPLVEDILIIQGAALGVFSVAETGMLVYQTGASSDTGQMMFWTDIEDGGLQPLGDPGEIFNPIISPDGQRAFIEVREASNEGTDLWLVDLNNGLRTRFTFAAGDEVRAVWSPSGNSVFYDSQHEGVFRIIEQPVDGQGGSTILLESDRDIRPTSLSPDEKYLLLDFEREDGKFEMRKLSLEAGNDEFTTLATSPENSVGGGMYSPDGRWVAYHSQTAAGWDIFVMPESGGTRKWQVTADGAAYPLWNPAGTEIWVSKFNGDLRTYSVDGSGQTFRVGDFEQKLTVIPPGGEGRGYDLHPDNQRVLQASIDPAFRSMVSFLHLVTDWQRALVQ